MLFDKRYSSCKVKQRIVVSQENRNEHVLTNNSGCDVYQFHIDGGINKTSFGERCDYIVEAQISPQPCAFVIELKGSDLNKAVSQILNTIEEYKLNLKGYIILPRIVIHKTSTHDIRGKKYRDLLKRYPTAVVKDRKYDLDVV